MAKETGKLVVYESNKVIEAVCQLGINEIRLILLCLAKIDQRELIDANKLYIVDIKEYAKIYNLNAKHAYQELLIISDRLYQATLTFKNSIFNENPRDKTITTTRWISSYVVNVEEKTIAIAWAAGIIPFICKLQGEFTRYSLEYIAGMTKIYSIRLYRLLKQYQGIGNREFTLADFRLFMGVEEGKYIEFNNLKRKVIEESVREINNKSDIRVVVKYIKDSRKIAGVSFNIKGK